MLAQKATSAQQVVLIGASFIALEVAASCAHEVLLFMWSPRSSSRLSV